MSDDRDDFDSDDIDAAELFRQQMAGVTPHKHKPKVSLKTAPGLDDGKAVRRAAAQQELAEERNHLVDSEVELLEPHCPLEYKGDGVQNGVYRKLKQGKYPQEARLDLHNMTVEHARHEVFEFIQQCWQYQLRVVTIVHGKGLNSKSNQALLKSYCNRWLRDLPSVQAFCSAQPRHGGAGAVYVQLKKSEQAKQENRDSLTRGRSQLD